MTPFRCMLAGLFSALACLSAAAEDAFERAMKEFGSSRKSVAELQDRAFEIERGDPTHPAWGPAVRDAQALLTQADQHLRKALECLAEGEKDGSIGAEASKLMRRYFKELEADLKQAQARIPGVAPPEEAAEPVKPEPERAAPKTQEVIRELQGHVEQFRKLSERAKPYTFGAASETLQKAFDKAAVKSPPGERGGGLYMTTTNCEGAIAEFDDPWLSEIARLEDGGEQDPAYLRYLRIAAERGRVSAEKFLVLADEYVRFHVRCGQAEDEGWFGSSEKDPGHVRTQALEREGEAIAGAIAAIEPDLARVKSREEFAQFTETLRKAGETLLRKPMPVRLRDSKKGGAPAKKDGGTGGMDELADVADRSAALFNFNRQLRGMEEKLRKDEPIAPGEYKELLDTIATLMGDRFPGARAHMSVLADKLESVEEKRQFFQAARSLASLMQSDGSATEMAARLRNYLQAVRPFADKVPGVGQFLEAYETAIDNALPQIATIENRARAAVEALRESREGGVVGASPDRVTLEEAIRAQDAALAEFAASRAPASVEPPKPAGPVLSQADLAELNEALMMPRAKLRGAVRECDELFPRVTLAWDAWNRLSKSKGADPARVAEARAAYDVLEEAYRVAKEYEQDMSRQYHSESDLWTRRLLERRAAESPNPR